MSPLSSLTRLCSLSLTTPKISSLRFTTSALADKLYTHLQNNPNNPENALNLIKPKLDPTCVHEVMKRLSLDNSQLGLRFFIWAGHQARYRHSSYMYSKACDLLRVRRNPGVVLDLLEAYRVNKCVIGVKMFKVVLSLCKEGRLANEALSAMRKMPEFGLRPDTNVYNVVIWLFCEDGSLDVARELLKEMEVAGLYPDMVTYVSLIKGFSNAGMLEEACGLLKLMKENGCAPNVVVYSTILDGIMKFGKLERALELLEEMENNGGDCGGPNVITYTSVIQSLCGKSKAMDALKVLERMEAYGRAPNRVTASTLIRGLCVDGCLEEAYELIGRVAAQGGVSYRDCYSSLVVSLIRLKKVKEAEYAFKSALAAGVKLDGVACTMMIKELCLEKRVLDGFRVLDEIGKSGWLSTLDSDIYSDILVGLCHGSHPLEAGKLARLMLQKKIRLEASYVDEVVEHLKHFGEEELSAELARHSSSLV